MQTGLQFDIYFDAPKDILNICKVEFLELSFPLIHASDLFPSSPLISVSIIALCLVAQDEYMCHI